MLQRGRILRDTSSGIGLISANGNQHEFKLEGMWKSDISPQQNMVVEFELDNTNQIIFINALSESQLAKEQAEKVLATAKEKGSAVFDDIVARVGKPVLIAAGLVAISWFFLSAITVQVSQDMSFKIPFWKILGVANNGAGGLSALQGGGGGDTGIYGFLAIVALLGPFASQFWKDSKAHLGNCLPLIMMFFVGITIYLGVQDSLQSVGNSVGSMATMFGGADANKLINDMASEMTRSVMKAIHIGMGAYISIAASTFLAFVGLKKYLAAKA